MMMNEWNKCLYCVHYDEFDGCEWGCYDHEDYKPLADRVIAKAHEKGICVQDVIELIEAEAE